MIKDNSLRENNDRELEGLIEVLNTYRGEPVLHDDMQATKDDISGVVSSRVLGASELSMLPPLPGTIPTVLGTYLSVTAKKKARKDLKYWSSSIAGSYESTMKPFKQMFKVCATLMRPGLEQIQLPKKIPLSY